MYPAPGRSELWLVQGGVRQTWPTETWMLLAPSEAEREGSDPPGLSSASPALLVPRGPSIDEEAGSEKRSTHQHPKQVSAGLGA